MVRIVAKDRFLGALVVAIDGGQQELDVVAGFAGVGEFGFGTQLTAEASASKESKVVP